MKTIDVISVDGEKNSVKFSEGDNLMEVLREAGYEEIMAMCGGCCSCATCHVYIDNQNEFDLPAVEEDEETLVSIADAYDADKSRLSCQLSLNAPQAGMIVQIVEPD